MNEWMNDNKIFIARLVSSLIYRAQPKLKIDGNKQNSRCEI